MRARWCVVIGSTIVAIGCPKASPQPIVSVRPSVSSASSSAAFRCPVVPLGPIPARNKGAAVAGTPKIVSQRWDPDRHDDLWPSPDGALFALRLFVVDVAQ